MDRNLQQEKAKATRVTLIGAVIDAILGVAKVIVGLMANSVALVADGIHSFSDLLTDALVLWASRHSREAPDTEHPYGHRRFETIAALIMGTVLFIVAGVIVYDSILRLYQDNSSYQIPGLFALVIAAVSIISKEWIYHFTKKTALEINSSLLLANAWHSRTDALSSIAVFIGITGGILGYPSADIFAAIFVALMISKIAWSLVAQNVRELVDTGLSQEELDLITVHLKQVEGVIGAHSLRSRRHGGMTLVDLHIQVSTMISVSEGHYIADQVTAAITTRFPTIKDVVVHIDPELDMSGIPAALLLPARQQATQALINQLDGVLTENQIHKIDFHYLKGKVTVVIYVNINILNKKLEISINNLLKELHWLDKVKVYGML